MQFCCSTCHSNLHFQAIHADNHKHNGYYTCTNCNSIIPVVNGITYYTEADIQYRDPIEIVGQLIAKIDGKRDDYQKFIQAKVRKGLIDPYSAFQPFNESSRAFYPFIESLKSEILEPNDVILDTWCRTGYSSFFLSAMFPEQQIISIWEGDKDVLGYQGFDYWFSSERKPANVQVIFSDLNKSIPLKDSSIKLVYGLDTLHRYDQHILIPELFRVISDDGAIIFPHIHLTNSNPEPFFERGEKQLHGLDYYRYFENYLEKGDYKAFINSEPGMFALDKSSVLGNDPNTNDYNAIIGILPKGKWEFELKPYHFNNQNIVTQFTLINHYLKIDLNSAKVDLDSTHLNGVVGKMLERHPVYHSKIKKAHGYELNELQIKILFLASNSYSNSEILTQLQISEDSLTTELIKLSLIEIVHVLPFSKNGMKLLSYHSARAPKNPCNHTLLHLKEIANNTYKDAVIYNVQDASELYKEDVSYLIGQIQSALLKSGCNTKNPILICSKPHFESLLIFWAAVEIGIEIGILNTDLPDKTKAELIEDLQPKLIFCDADVYKRLITILNCSSVVVLDDVDYQGDEERLFSTWIESMNSYVADFSMPIIKPESPAVILYTSGTTGKPKGIRLNHGALFKSGQLLAETYGWNSDDKLLMIAELDAMSGLRNTCIATQFSGTTIVIPDYEKGNKVFTIIETIKEQNITLLSTTPSLINQLVQLGNRIRGELKTLRQVICTGGKLTKKQVDEFENIFGLRVFNYYGLTETTGLCIGECPDAIGKGDSIGVPLGATAQIVNEKDEVLNANETGKLRIYNDRLMSGYLNENDSSNLQIHDGWLYTGDLASRDENGFFYLMGRERDIIKDSKGNIIYLSEIEVCLQTHENVKDVVVCCTENDGNEYLVAFVISDTHYLPQMEDILKEYVGSELGKQKVPRSIEFLDLFPIDNRGQTDKKRLLQGFQ